MAPDSTLPRRILVTHAGPEAFAPMTHVIMAKLGYFLIDPDEWETRVAAGELKRPDLRLVDERRLAEVTEDGGAAIPIVALTGRHGVTGADPRIVAAIRRPAGLHEIFRVAQQVLEDVPRATLRVPTHLSARCHRRGREWLAVVLSISENGCLLRTPEPLFLGSELTIRFELPGRGVIEVEGEATYQLVPDFGVVFNSSTPKSRNAIASYVTEALAAV